MKGAIRFVLWSTLVAGLPRAAVQAQLPAADAEKPFSKSEGQ
jgi:hypothetical protein